ncbi:DUF1803 domain-containing protein [Enterococcus sp. BWR-S5]|uniref:DUF1803 domain-containing protein n=1 Tax=Enterococcus sp. BWR-S5 TaxID=2787714 RepID=UPI0019209049|nr:DUF1803 domain-containing protein [Enterococcus sp. BWR-S5]MBL1224615.1 DUF1803 domain-containing protein [Enterococcus sp. BWR-S5]
MTVTYYFQHKNQKKLEKLVNNPLFNQIVTYFSEHRAEKIILRELKKIFQERNFEQFLEEMIDFQLIRREERRYYMEIPFFNTNGLEKEKEAAKLFVKKHKDENVEESCYLFGEALWDELFSAEDSFFFGVIDSSDNFFEKQAYGNEQLTFVSIHQKNSQPLDFASYFAAMEATSGDKLPKVYQPLQELIGDVDSNYFAAQTYRIIRAVLKNRRVADKRNIFLESLVMIEQLKKTEDGWQLLAPVIQRETSISNEQLYTYVATYKQIDDHNQRVFHKMYFYFECLTTFLANQESLSYLVI